MVIFLYLLTFSIYIFTLSPAVYWGDSAEFSATSYLLDIPHQPAYPLYNLLGKLFNYLPIGSIATRCNLLSSFFSALTVVIIYLIFMQIFRSLKYKNNEIIAFIGTLLYSFSYTFWNQSTFAEVYTLFVFIVSSLILILLVLRNNEDKFNFNYRLFYLFVFICGISITHHFLILPLGSAFLFFIIINDNLRVELLRRLPLLIFLFILPLTIYLYLPLRSAQNPILDWGNPENFTQIKYTISLQSPKINMEVFPKFILNEWRKIQIIFIPAQIIVYILFLLPFFTGFLIISKSIPQKTKNIIFSIKYIFLILCIIFSYGFIMKFVPFYERVQGFHYALLFEFLIREFPIYILWTAILGIFFLYKKNKEMLLFFLFLFLLSSTLIIYKLFPSYRPYDHDIFFIVSNLVLTIFIVMGILYIKTFLGKFNKIIKFLPEGILFVIIIFFIFLNNYRIINKNDYYYAEDLINNINSSITDNSLILIDGVDIYFLLYYYFNQEGIKDKKMVYLDGMSTKWYFERLKEENFLSKNLIFSPQLKSEKVIDDLINSNYKKYKLYYAATGSFAREAINKYCLKPRGLVSTISFNKKPCKYTESDIAKNKRFIYQVYKYRGIEKKIKDRKATGVTNIYGGLHQNLAVMYLSLNKIDDAISELKKSIVLFPQNSSSYEMLSYIYLQRGDISSAIKNLEKAVKYDVGNVYLMNRLGMLYIDRGQPDRAEDILKKCIKIYPEFMEGHYNLGVVYQKLNKMHKAIKHFEIAKRIAPNISAPYIALGKLFYEIGNHEDAKNEFEKAIEIEPDNAKLQEYLKELKIKIGKH